MVGVVSILVAILFVRVNAIPEPDREQEHPVWTRETSRNLVHYMQENEDTAILKPQDFKGPCDEDGLIWIFVTTAPTHFQARFVSEISSFPSC